MVSAACIGEHCWCGEPAVKKVGEEILFDDPMPHRHNLTSYICAEHYAQLMGPLGAKQVGLAASGMETRQGGDGTAPSRSDDSPARDSEDAQKSPND